MQTMTKPFPSRKASIDLSQLQNQRHPVIWDASVLLWYIWKQWSLATQSVLWEREYQSKRQRRWHLTADPRCWTSYSCSVTKSCPTLCDPMDCSTPGFPSFTIFWSLLQLTSIELVILSNHLIFCHPLLFLPSIFPSIRVFSNELALRIKWPKFWSFSFSISPSNEYSGLG